MSTPGAIYHVTCRGVERSALFLDTHDRSRFLTDQCRQRQARCPKDVAFRQVQVRRSAEEVLPVVAAAFGLRAEDLRQRRYRCRARATAARMLWVHAGVNQRDVGRELGMGTGAAVCQQLRMLERTRASDEKLDQRLRQIDERLSLNS